MCVCIASLITGFKYHDIFDNFIKQLKCQAVATTAHVTSVLPGAWFEYFRRNTRVIRRRGLSATLPPFFPLQLAKDLAINRARRIPQLRPPDLHPGKSDYN